MKRAAQLTTIVSAFIIVLNAMMFAPVPYDPDAAAASTLRYATPPHTGTLSERIALTCPAPTAMPRARCAQWLLVAQCETGGQQWSVSHRSLNQIVWSYNGSSGYDGGLQFSPSTWTSNVARIPSIKLTRYQRLQRRAGRYHHAWSAPSSVQILAAEVLRVRIGGNPEKSSGWPHCGAWFYG